MWVFLTLLTFGTDTYVFAGTKIYETQAQCEADAKVYIKETKFPLPIKCVDPKDLPKGLQQQDMATSKELEI